MKLKVIKFLGLFLVVLTFSTGYKEEFEKELLKINELSQAEIKEEMIVSSSHGFYPIKSQESLYWTAYYRYG